MVALNHSFYAPKWHLLISYSIERSNSSVKHQCVQSALTLKLRGCSMTHEFCTNHVLTCDFWKYSFPLHVRPCLHVCLDTPLHPSPLGGYLTDTCQQSMVKILSNDMQLLPCFPIIQKSMLYLTNCLHIYIGKCYQQNILHPIKTAAITQKCM